MPLCWSELVEPLTIGPQLIQKATDKIRKIQKHIKAVQSQQKSYAYTRRSELEFQVGDKVLLKVSPGKGVRRSNIRGKLSIRYIGPFEIIEKLNPIAQRLDLLVELEHVDNVFHTSQLRKDVLDPNQVIVYNQLRLLRI